MGTIKKHIIIDDEIIANLKHCLERTNDMWEYGLDMWPFDIQYIILEWESNANLSSNQFSNEYQWDGK